MQIKIAKHTTLWGALLLAATLGTSSALLADKKDDDDHDNIVAGIISAPVVMNGTVANEPTEFNLIFNAQGKGLKRALDPELFGFQIPAGGRMEVELSDEFTRNTRIISVSGAVEPVPINPNANIILTTGPQNPIIFAPGTTVARGNWSVSDDGNNLITITPNGGSGDNGLENARANEIGMKVIHVRPNPRVKDGTPFINGNAGEVGRVTVRIYDAESKLKHSGSGKVKFKPRVGRQVHNTNDGLRTTPGGSPLVETIELIDFQRVGPNTALTNDQQYSPFSAGYPYAPRFLLFEELDQSVRGQFTEASYIRQPGIENVTYEVNARKPWKAKLIQVTTTGNVTIGKIEIKGHDDSHGTILPSPGLTTIGGNGSHLTVPVRVGDEDGKYKVKVSLSGGGSATTTIIVEEEEDEHDDDDDDDDD